MENESGHFDTIIARTKGDGGVPIECSAKLHSNENANQGFSKDDMFFDKEMGGGGEKTGTTDISELVVENAPLLATLAAG